MFVEISPSLAKAKGIKPGNQPSQSHSGESLARPLLSPVPPLTSGPPGRQNTVEMVALPWHFGSVGYATGGPDCRTITPSTSSPMEGDANAETPEYKVFLVDIVKA